MVREYGMSQKLGQVYFANDRRPQFLGAMPEGRSDYSEATAETIDEEVREIIGAQYQVAREILERRRPVLEKAAALLLEKEKIDGEELKRLVAESET
jgi:cell division protease FtsH